MHILGIPSLDIVGMWQSQHWLSFQIPPRLRGTSVQRISNISNLEPGGKCSGATVQDSSGDQFFYPYMECMLNENNAKVFDVTFVVLTSNNMRY